MEKVATYDDHFNIIKDKIKKKYWENSWNPLNN
jgi:hypothetical protein